MSPEPSKKQTKHKAATVRIPEDLHDLFQSLTDARVFNKVVVGLLHMYEQHPEVQEYLVNTSAKDEEAAQRSLKRLMRVINAPMLAENGRDAPDTAATNAGGVAGSDVMNVLADLQAQIATLKQDTSTSPALGAPTSIPAPEARHDEYATSQEEEGSLTDDQVDDLLG
jgi:hypothetical protein